VATALDSRQSPISRDTLMKGCQKSHFVGLTAILREAWNTSQQTEEEREFLHWKPRTLNFKTK
jgi:hypothetical protein